MASKLVIHSFISKVLGLISGTLLVLLTSRWLGAELRGEINLLLIWTGLWITLSDFVSGSALINLSATFSWKKLWRVSFIWVAMFSLAAFLFHWAWPPIATLSFAIIAFMVLVMGLFNTQASLLIGLKQITLRNYIFASISAITLVLFVLFYLYFGFQGISSYVWAWVLAWFMACLISFIALFSFKSTIVKTETIRLVQIVKFGSASQFGHLVQYAAARLPHLFIPLYFDNAVLGVFAVAVVMGESILFVPASFGQVLHASIVHMEDKRFGLANLMRYIRFSILYAIIIVLGVSLIPSDFWIWLLKEDFAHLATYFRLLAPAVLFQTVASLLSHFFHGANQFRVLIKANLIGLFVAVIAMFALYKAGVAFVILAIVLGSFSQLIYLIYLMGKYYKIGLISYLPTKETLQSSISFLLKKG